jgi:nicotinamide mononucleotide transporter
MFKNWTKFEISWLLISTLVLSYIFVTTGYNVLGLATGLLGLLYVVNVARANVWCFIFGGLQVLLYAYISFQSKVYGEFALNLIYTFPMLMYGFVAWKKHKHTDDSLEVKALTKKRKYMLFAFWAITIVVAYYGLKLIGGNTPILDSMATITSVVALFLAVHRYKEQWILWIIVNGLTFTLWVFAVLRGDVHGLPMVGMWGAYFINSLYGYYNWNKLSKK